MCRKPVLLVLACLLGLAPITSAGLVGWWKFDEGSGTVAADSSGNGYDGTITNATWETGQLGQALGFDGTAYVDVPAEAWSTIETQVTVAFWAYGDPDSQPQSNFICGAFQDPDNNESRALSAHVPWSNGTIYFDTGGSTTDTYDRISLAGDAADYEGTWTHWALIKNADTGDQQIYINGVLWHSGTGMVRPMVGVTKFTIGTKPSLQEGWYYGMIDDFQLYNRALGQDELATVLQGGTVSFPLAYGPEPGDGVMIAATTAELKWKPGDYATSHNVYFGTDREAVANATPEDADLLLASTSDTSVTLGLPQDAYPEALVPGTTYYWRVDEVSDDHPDSPWTGEIWSFRVQPATAWDPTPGDAIEFVDPEVQLTWQTGLGGLFHTVYFGESFDEVNDAVADGFMTAGASYDPSPLESDKTYYWRVDEFAQTGTIKGDVWSFTTMPEIPLADDPNLILWYTLDEGNGATAVDWSGHGHHGSIFGQPLWADGVHGGALDFDGDSTGIDMDDAVVDSTFTLAMWLKPRDIPYTTGYYAVLHDDQWNAGAVHVHLRASTSVYGVDINGGGALTSTTVLRSGEWYHFASLIDATGTENQLYVNGVLESTAEPAGAPYLGPLNFGAWTNNQRFYHGLMDDIRIYDDLLTEAEIQQILRGDPLLAWSPDPGRDAIVDIREATSLIWQAGDTAVSHDVYFGTDKDAPEFQGNQPGTSFPLAGRVEFGGGDYFWRIDEVEADGTVHGGNVWMFTVPDFLVVDDFESYTNEVGSRVFEAWIDGIGFTLPEPGDLGNGTGAAVGHDIWTGGFTNLMETANVHGGGQAMPLYYDNTVAPAVSEADRTFTPGQNWTVEGVTTLVVHFRGAPDNTGDLYVEINGVKVPYDGDPADIASADWIAWEIDLASVGVSLTNITTLTIGIEGGETGVVYVDDIILTGS